MFSSTSTTILNLLLATASLTSALPQPKPLSKRQTTYYSVGLSADVSGVVGSGPIIHEPIPVEINVLAVTTNLSASQISFDGSASNVNVSTVECRAFKDATGVVPGSAAFTQANPAVLGTNVVGIGSVLCYVAAEL